VREISVKVTDELEAGLEDSVTVTEIDSVNVKALLAAVAP